MTRIATCDDAVLAEQMLIGADDRADHRWIEMRCQRLGEKRFGIAIVWIEQADKFAGWHIQADEEGWDLPDILLQQLDRNFRLIQLRDNRLKPLAMLRRSSVINHHAFPPLMRLIEQR